MAFQNVISDNSFKNLSRVPEEVLSMVNLRMLYMDGNSLDSLPVDFFERLPNLYWLDLRGNRLVDIPKGIGNHKFLENLLLQHNLIQRLPDELGLVPNLKVLQLSDNPLEYPSQEIIDKGVESICEFLKQEHFKKNTPTKKEHDGISSMNSYSTASISTPSVHTSPKKRLTNKIEKPPPLVVTALSKASSPPSILHESGRKEKKIHRILRSPSKISVRSHYSGKSSLNRVSWNVIDEERQDQRVLEEQVREAWLNKLKELIKDQEKILQQERTLERLSSWRQEKKEEPQRSAFEELKRVSSTPFDTNPVYNKLMTRSAVVLKNVEKMVSLQNLSKRKTQEDVDKLISDVVIQLKELEKKLQKTGADDEGNSPALNLQNAEEEIHLISNLHKQIAKIQSENNLR